MSSCKGNNILTQGSSSLATMIRFHIQRTMLNNFLIAMKFVSVIIDGFGKHLNNIEKGQIKALNELNM